MKSVDTKQSNIDKIIAEFNTCNELRLKGKLEITNPQSKSWLFYFLLGRVVWSTGGVHPVRRYFRHLTNNCQDIDINKLRFRASELNQNYWDYKVLNILHKRKKIEVETVVSIVDNTLEEILFEIIQQAETGSQTGLSLACFRDEQELIDAPITISSAEKFAHQIKKVQKQWQMWEEAGLRKVSPNLAPILRKPEELKAQKGINERIYKTFVTLINGKFTLFDLSIKMKQGILPLTKSLLPYIKKGIIDLIEVPDLDLPVIQEANKTTLIQQPDGKKGYLIACIDDSPQICQILNHIITKAGYRFLGIQDSVQALGALIEHRPDLVFLDLVMPVANGYEVCSQIRRVSILADTPVVILTGNDGLVDRVRAKMVGANDFMGKPVEAEKVLAMIQKHVLATHTELNQAELN